MRCHTAFDDVGDLIVAVCGEEPVEAWLTAEEEQIEDLIGGDCACAEEEGPCLNHADRVFDLLLLCKAQHGEVERLRKRVEDLQMEIDQLRGYRYRISEPTPEPTDEVK